MGCVRACGIKSVRGKQMTAMSSPFQANTAAPAVLILTRRLTGSSDAAIFQLVHPECRWLDSSASAESSATAAAAAEPALVYLCQVGGGAWQLSRHTDSQLAAEFAELNPRLEAPVGRVQAAILAELDNPAAELRLLSPSLLQLSGHLSERAAAGTEFRWQFQLQPATADALDALLIRPLAVAAAVAEAEAADARDKLGRLGRAAAQLASDNGLRCPRHIAELAAVVDDTDKTLLPAAAPSLTALADTAGERWRRRLARAAAAAAASSSSSSSTLASNSAAASKPDDGAASTAAAAVKPAKDERLLLRVEDPAERDRREEAKRKLEAEKLAGKKKNAVKKKKKGLF